MALRPRIAAGLPFQRPIPKVDRPANGKPEVPRAPSPFRTRSSGHRSELYPRTGATKSPQAATPVSAHATLCAWIASRSPVARSS